MPMTIMSYLSEKDSSEILSYHNFAYLDSVLLAIYLALKSVYCLMLTKK